jgi:hypothetical protein
VDEAARRKPARVRDKNGRPNAGRDQFPAVRGEYKPMHDALLKAHTLGEPEIVARRT